MSEKPLQPGVACCALTFGLLFLAGLALVCAGVLLLPFLAAG